MTTNYTHIINENLDMFDMDGESVVSFPEYCDDDETVEVIALSESEQDFANIGDDVFYGDIGLAMGYQWEAVNVSDKRFPVGKKLYFGCTFGWGLPKKNDEFQNWYAHDLGWELTGRVVFRGYYNEHYDFEEREHYYTEATREEIERAR